MADTVDTRPVQQSALRALPADAPDVIINLLKFKQGGGRERYLQYAQEVAPYLEKVGADVRYGGAAPVNVIGDDEKPWWDAILVVEYPTPSAFVEMVRDPGYQKVHVHRAAALERGDLIATSTWTMAD